jgi:hypothetical protein
VVFTAQDTVLLVAGFPANRNRRKDLENAAFGTRRLTRSTVSFFWGGKGET